jgi:hypothetical protein
MLSLLVLSLALSTSSAAQTAVVPGDSLAVEPPSLNLMDQGLSRQMPEDQVKTFDPMEIRPDADVCFKIRAYIFSTGPVPKLLRETTCGPKRPTAKNVEGTQPKFVPLDAGEQPVAVPER